MSDTEDEDAEYANIVEEFVVDGNHNKKKGARIVWSKIYRHYKIGGKQMVSYPFLADDNVIDKVVVAHLVHDEPYCRTAHGIVAKAWKDCADNINKEKLDSTGNPLFFPPLNSKTLKCRFEAYMKFAASKKAAVPFNSGCDDEEEPGEIEQGIEEMYENYTSFMDEKATNKQSALSNKKGEKAAAEIIRRASLGMKPSEDELEECAQLRGYVDKKKRASSGSSVSSMRSSSESLQDAMEQRNQIMLMNKEENKKRKLEMYQQRLVLEEKKMNAEAKNTEAMHNLLLQLAGKMTEK
jgi:hypothetical protein